MLDEVTLTNLDDLFTVRKYDVIPFEMPDKFWVSVTFEMDLNVTHIERKLYTVFDMLGCDNLPILHRQWQCVLHQL